MKIAYIAHPISGNIRNNLEMIKLIVRHINLTEPEVLPFAHYWLDCHALDDTIPEERERGIKNDIELMKAGFIDEVWLYGDKISKGMKHEIELADKLGIPVVAKTEETKAALLLMNEVLNDERNASQQKPDSKTDDGQQKDNTDNFYPGPRGEQRHPDSGEIVKP